MRLLKTHSILGLANSYLVDSPQPANIFYIWKFGVLLWVCLLIKILTGVFLAIHYTPSVDLAFCECRTYFVSQILLMCSENPRYILKNLSIL